MAEEMDWTRVGVAIQDLRWERRLSTHRLANRAGVSDPYMRDIENGIAPNVSLPIVLKVTNALNVTVDQLLARAGVYPSPRGEHWSSEAREAAQIIDRLPEVLRNGAMVQLRALAASVERTHLRAAEDGADYPDDNVKPIRPGQPLPPPEHIPGTEIDQPKAAQSESDPGEQD